uniref:Phospholipid-transporting ATPase n=1 Tax=Macrostomum lignano TaxID=282301 RepID=A0A1I8J0X5_9PLAT
YTPLQNQLGPQLSQEHPSQQSAAYKERVIHLNRADAEGRVQFRSNSISTTKYTVVTFWPKFLFEQFRKAPNAFFFLIALLQQIPGISPTGRFTTAVPLSIIMLLTAIKEVVEDWVRQSLPATSEHKQPSQLHSLQGQLVCEPPDDDTTKFKGSLYLDQVRYPVSLNQLLMRGTCLRKTSYVIGLVVYTGADTKVMKNSKPVPLKRSRVERESNRYFLLLLLILAFFTLFTTVANMVWTSRIGPFAWYITNNEISVGHFGAVLITCFIMFHTIVPISLQVTLEFMRIFQAYFIQCDLDMYDPIADIAAEARTSSLNEELGQVNFIFSDKTGTLTQNSMVFQGATVAGRMYGDAVSNGAEAYEFVSGVNSMRSEAAQGQNKDLDDFLSILTVCHTVIPERDSHDNLLEYSASSPDESALVYAAKDMGYELFERSLDTFVIVKVNGEMRRFEVLATFEFTSDRKRMSMVVRCPNGAIRVFCKGADSVIFSRLQSPHLVSETTNHMSKFAMAGLRTLCIAVGDMPQSEWSRLHTEYENARNDIERREAKLALVAEKLEKNLRLLGATAIEDRLQVGVPATINDLLLAGIRIWVLTGDKLETAVNIGYSCRLLQPEMEVRSAVAELSHWLCGIASVKGKEPALVIEGESLSWASHQSVRNEFIDVCLQCRTVICCRVSPKQKSDVVRYVREAMPSAVTLAIGDGANDVPMIQESHVGVGLKGKEGLQAAAASDYSLSQFRFLKKLLLVHGAWNYHRVTIVILFSFYKNITIYVTAFWFALWTQALYNVFFTGATPFALGVWDRSCSVENCMRYPQLYRESQGSDRYNFKVFALWMLNGVYHSAIIFLCVLLAVSTGAVFSDGKTAGLYYLGSLVYAIAVITVGLKAGLEHTAWTGMSHLAIWGGIGNYLVFLVISSNFFPHAGGNFSEVVGYDRALFGSGMFWYLLMLVPALALTRDVAWKAYKKTCRKTLREEVFEMEKLRKDPSTVLFQGTYRKVTEKARLLRNAVGGRSADASANLGDSGPAVEASRGVNLDEEAGPAASAASAASSAAEAGTVGRLRLTVSH